MSFIENANGINALIFNGNDLVFPIVNVSSTGTIKTLRINHTQLNLIDLFRGVEITIIDNTSTVLLTTFVLNVIQISVNEYDIQIISTISDSILSTSIIRYNKTQNINLTLPSVSNIQVRNIQLNSVLLKWKEPDINITGYLLRYKESNNSSWLDIELDKSITNYILTNLSSRTSYDSKIIGIYGLDKKNSSPASPIVTYTTK